MHVVSSGAFISLLGQRFELGFFTRGIGEKKVLKKGGVWKIYLCKDGGLPQKGRG